MPLYTACLVSYTIIDTEPRCIVADVAAEAVAELRLAVLLVAAVGADEERLAAVGALRALVHGQAELAVDARAHSTLLLLLVDFSKVWRALALVLRVREPNEAVGRCGVVDGRELRQRRPTRLHI